MIIELPTFTNNETKHKKLNYRISPYGNRNPKQFRFIKCLKNCKSVIKFEFYDYPNPTSLNIVKGQIKKTDITNVLILQNINELMEQGESSQASAFKWDLSYIMSNTHNLFDNFETILKFKNTKWIKQI